MPIPLAEVRPPLSHEERCQLFNARLARAGVVYLTREALATWREGLPCAMQAQRSTLDEGGLPERMTIRRVTSFLPSC